MDYGEIGKRHYLLRASKDEKLESHDRQRPDNAWQLVFYDRPTKRNS